MQTFNCIGYSKLKEIVNYFVKLKAVLVKLNFTKNSRKFIIISKAAFKKNSQMNTPKSLVDYYCLLLIIIYYLKIMF